jgi:hypothetical protein
MPSSDRKVLIRWTVGVVVFAMICLGFFVYISNRMTHDQAKVNTVKIDRNYAQNATIIEQNKEVLALLKRIVK